MATARIFWLVKGRGPAEFEHKTLNDAEREAKRLSLASPGEVFHVMSPNAAFVKEEIHRIDLQYEAAEVEHTGQNEVPF